MTAYTYRALDERGKLTKGVVEGDSERQVRSQLRARNMRPMEVKASSEKRGSNDSQAPWTQLFKPRIKTTELALLTRQLATLVQSNLPLDECIQATAQQTRKPRLKSLLLQVRSRVVEGHTLAYAMGEYPQIFSELYRSMVKAGEHAGFLGQVLEQLADYTEQRQDTQQKMKMAMIYPVVLVVVAVSVVAALMVLVVPELVQIFTHTQKELPAITRYLIAISDFVRTQGLTVLIALLALAIACKQMMKRPQIKRRWHQFLLAIPGFSGLIIATDTARFASTLSILISSGVPLLDALRISGEVLSNHILREASIEVAQKVQEGGSLHRAMEQSSHFPPMMVHMVASGEASGELEVMLARAASNQERELEMAIGAMMAILPPLMVVIMGIIVLGIVAGILLPIFELNTIAGR